ncbi:hypothetical protein A499_06485 [Niallia nealsonii AAU1]|nr:hypothetical protein A499_06485 [Niallia nealsonii AAU1]
MSDKMDEVRRRYSHEINEVANKLRDLENGRIKEITDVNMDGYLSTNIISLRKDLNDLFAKVVNGSDSVTDEFDKWFK